MTLRLASLLLLLLPLASMQAATLPSPGAVAAATATDDAADRATGQRLDARLAGIRGLHDVNASISSGVARLEGEVVTEDERKLAGDIAAQTRGVARVENRIVLSANLSDRFESGLQAVTAKLVRLLAAAPLLLVAIAIVVLAAWSGRLLSRRMRWTRRLRSPNPYMDGLVRRVVQSLALLAGILVALDLLGATSLVGAVLGSAGVVGLVLGFAFRDIAENYIAGVLLSLRRPFAPGEHVVIDNREGKVVALTSRATILMTLDGNELRLPNAMVFKAVVLNYSRNPQRRLDFVLTIDPSESIREAHALALDEISRVEGVLADPAPSWVLQDYLPTGSQLRFFAWVDQRESDLGKVRSEAIRVVKGAFARAGIDAPRTVTHVALHREAGGPAAGMPATGPEPVHEAVRVDTSVNRDIDRQLADAQRATDADDLLEQKMEPAGGGTPQP
jgi:small-conductance mechanosensitive channel